MASKGATDGVRKGAGILPDVAAGRGVGGELSLSSSSAETTKPQPNLELVKPTTTLSEGGGD